MGISAHAGAISAISVSFDGKYLFSAGRGDQSSYMYELCLGDDGGVGKADSIQHSGAEGQPTDIVRTSGSLEPFLSLLEGGKGGDLHEDIIDYFYYCQLRAQGEDSMEERAVTGRIPVDEIPALMRAVGFYPSEAQVVDMLNEVHMIDRSVSIAFLALYDYLSLLVLSFHTDALSSFSSPIG
jgi:cilia- and flagella-associated protein 251